MTLEERVDRLEHYSAAFVEERRQQREEDRQLWRDTQRQINELSVRVVQIADEFREADKRLEARIDQLATESRAADQRLGERIDALVTAIGQLTARMGIPPQPSGRT